MARNAGPVVVPLDGSQLSERALAYAALCARALDTGILLVTAWEGPDHGLAGRLPEVAKDLELAAQEFYGQHLTDAAKKLGNTTGLSIKTQVLVGQPVDEILRTVEQQHGRLLVLASHGRSGLGRWWYGSVAGDLVRRAPVSTLVIGPRVLEQDAKEGVFRRILVPLDGSDLSEVALATARELAETFGAEIVLARVLTWAGQAYILDVSASTMGQVDRELTEVAEEYLAETAGQLGSSAGETFVLRGTPADALIDLVGREGIDLAVMSSHGRGGLTRVALGSVADRMLQCAAPVLLVRPEVVAGKPPQ